MTESTHDPDDGALDARARAALRGDPGAPPPQVRNAILEHARKLSEERRATPDTRARTPLRASNDPYWRVPAVAAMVAAVALLIARPMLEQSPAPAPSPSVPAARPAAAEQVHELAAPEPAAVQAQDRNIAARAATAAPAAKAATSVATSPGSATADRHSTADPGADAPSVAASPVSGDPGAGVRSAPMLRPAAEGARILSPSAARRAEAGDSADAEQAARMAQHTPYINEIDAQGSTALMRAIEQNAVGTVRLLIARGADPNVANAAGETPLSIARRQQLVEIVRLLEEAGAH